MSMVISIVPQKATCCLATSSNLDPAGLLSISTIKPNRYSFAKHKLGGFSGGLVRSQNDSTSREMNVAVGATAPRPLLPLYLFNGPWKNWILGHIVLTIILSFSTGRWAPLLQFKKKIDKALEKAEDVADIVEEVADDIENVAESAANHLPKGKLRDAADYIDKVAEQVEKDAHLAGEALQKVEDVEEQIESFLESNFYPHGTVTTTADDKKSKVEGNKIVDGVKF